MAKSANLLSTIDLGNKYSWVISNTHIDKAKDLGLTGIRKY